MRKRNKFTKNFVNFMARLSPEPLKAWVRKSLPRAELGYSLWRGVFPQPAGVALISFPKCGRTWLILMLSRAFQLQFGIDPQKSLLDIRKLHSRYPEIPRLAVSHDDNPHHKLPSELQDDKSSYRNAKVIFLVRDPRDVMVSLYFENTRRVGALYAKGKEFHGDVASFIRQERGGLASLIRFYNIWAANRHLPKGFLLVRYGDLHADPHGQFRRILEFMGLEQITDVTVAEAVDFTRFDNMQRMERRERFPYQNLQPGDVDDPESYKTRRGVVGGYVDYLAPDDVDYINQQLSARLDPYFGYS